MNDRTSGRIAGVAGQIRVAGNQADRVFADPAAGRGIVPAVVVVREARLGVQRPARVAEEVLCRRVRLATSLRDCIDSRKRRQLALTSSQPRFVPISCLPGTGAIKPTTWLQVGPDHFAFRQGRLEPRDSLRGDGCPPQANVLQGQRRQL